MHSLTFLGLDNFRKNSFFTSLRIWKRNNEKMYLKNNIDIHIF